jgi:hypothetical protein
MDKTAAASWLDAQRMSCFEGGYFSGDTFDRTAVGFSQLAVSIRSDLSPPKNPNIRPTSPLFALHASLLTRCSP